MNIRNYVARIGDYWINKSTKEMVKILFIDANAPRMVLIEDSNGIKFKMTVGYFFDTCEKSRWQN